MAFQSMRETDSDHGGSNNVSEQSFLSTRIVGSRKGSQKPETVQRKKRTIGIKMFSETRILYSSNSPVVVIRHLSRTDYNEEKADGEIEMGGYALKSIRRNGWSTWAALRLWWIDVACSRMKQVLPTSAQSFQHHPEGQPSLVAPHELPANSMSNCFTTWK